MPRLEELDDESPATVKDKARGSRSGRRKSRGAGSGSRSSGEESTTKPDDATADLSVAVVAAVGRLAGKRLRRGWRPGSVHPLVWVAGPDQREHLLAGLLNKAWGETRPGRLGDPDRKWNRQLAGLAAEKRFAGLSQREPADAFELVAAAWLVCLGSDPRQPDGHVWRERLVAELLAATDGLDEFPHAEPLVWLWTQVELLLVIAAALPEGEPVRDRLARRATQRLEEWFENSVDEEGCLPGRMLGDAGPVAAAAARVASLARMVGETLSPLAAGRLDWMIRQWMLLIGTRGSLPLSQADVAADDSLAAALKSHALEREDHRLIERQLLRRAWPDRKLPDPGHFSETQGTGLLRGSWSRSAARIAIGLDGQEMAVEIAGRTPLIAGKVETLWSFNGRPLEWDEPSWTLNLWHEDKDVHYLELQLTNEAGWTFQRLIALVREDDLLLVGDSLIGTGPGRLDYRVAWPLANGVSASQAAETREVILRRDEPAAAVLPASISEWQRDHSGHAFSASPGSLSLDQSLVGTRMFAATVFDLSPRRAVKPRTWRALTVGEGLVTVPSDVAVAYRVQSGRQQWVIYRSLADCGNRTFLGANVCHDFYLGRFDRDGKHESLLLIEP